MSTQKGESPLYIVIDYYSYQ